MHSVHSLRGLVELIGPRLRLRWLTPPPAQDPPLTGQRGAQSLVGSLNCIHPNRLQVLGRAEMAHLAALRQDAFTETIEHLFAAGPAAVIFSDGIEPPPIFFELSQQCATPLLGTAISDEDVIDRLQHYLTFAMAERTVAHGVFMQVLGMGVLLQGEPGIGKSELALELVARGHRLIADDAPEIARIGPEILEGSCPPMLRDFLEVRGLGVLNIRAMFGEDAVRERDSLSLVVTMRSFTGDELTKVDRLRGSLSVQTLLGVPIPEVTLPVAPGRNLAVLLETAVRSQTLRIRGYDAGVDLIERQARAVEETGRAVGP